MGAYEIALKDIISTRKEIMHKSFFIKRIEKALEGKMNVSEKVLNLFDTPFDRFTPDCEELFERELVQNSVFWMFSDLLEKVYDEMNANRQGWEAQADFLDDTPIKYCALHAMEKVEKRKSSRADGLCGMDDQVDLNIRPEDEKFGVRPYIENSRNRRRKNLRLCYA